MGFLKKLKWFTYFPDGWEISFSWINIQHYKQDRYTVIRISL